jgi:NAD-dependent deacetylase
MMEYDRQIISRVVHKENIVFITGAGISVASGIPAYRSGPNALWDEYTTEMMTRKKFLSDPVGWQEWYDAAHAELLSGNPKPNAAHIALNEVVGPTDIIITQNIDRLQTDAGTPDYKVIHIHGRHDIYICSSDKKPKAKYDCSYRKRGVNTFLAQQYNYKCPYCKLALIPFILMFDQSYTDHPDFQIGLAVKKVKAASALVFIGTSFSVGFTELALSIAQRKNKDKININLVNHPKIVDSIVGPAEVVLPIWAEIKSKGIK